MTVWHRQSGDVGDTVEPFLDGISTLVGATAVTATVDGCDGGPVTLTGSVLNPVNPQVRIGLDPWLATAAQGDWNTVFHVFFGATRLTWPSRGHDTIRVT